jgi:thioredoxin-like negative regulator of GroEL
VRVYKVDTEASPELAAHFRIRGIPALLFIPKTGNPSLSSGFLPKDALKRIIHDVLKVESQSGGCCPH